MQRDRGRDGFTLVELMMTLVVISIAAAVSVPVVQQAVRDRQLQQRAIGFTNAFREARSRAAFRFAAQLVRVDLTAAQPLQQIVEGDSSSCTMANFPVPFLISTNLELQQNNDVGVTNIRPGASYVEFCFTPLGRMFYRYDAAGAFTDDNGLGIGRPLNGGFEYRFTNTAYPATTNRRVIITLDGSPRMAQ